MPTLDEVLESGGHPLRRGSRVRINGNAKKVNGNYISLLKK